MRGAVSIVVHEAISSREKVTVSVLVFRRSESGSDCAEAGSGKVHENIAIKKKMLASERND